MAEAKRKEYIEAIELAESGRYEQALERMRTYLKSHPTDGEALNDAGTILYCMHRGQEAIDYFLRARSCSEGEIQTQVIFNLCEAYLAEDQPEKAVTLLEPMESMHILNVDTINRIANGFVNKLAYGPAIEMLLYSLRTAPAQEILKPMLEIVRSKRIGLTLYADHEQRLVDLRNYLEPRYPVQTCIGSALSADSMRQGNSVSIFVGCGSALVRAGNQGSAAVLFLDYEDLGSSQIEQVPWPQIGALVVPSQQVVDLLTERIGTLPASLRILTIPPGVDVETIQYTERKKGKRIAAIGPWTAHQNPMFLLHCMQKLHYLDPDMRLHLAGDFEDLSIRQYTESMIESMDLGNTVFLDGVPKNWNRWLKDKHYIVSTAVDGRGLSGVFTGMAAGLRPVVQQFPHAEDFVETEYLFLLAEDFCRQILEGSYQPPQYRETAINRYSTLQIYTPLIRVLSEIEHRILLSSRPQQTAEVPVTESTSRRIASPAPSQPAPALWQPAAPAENRRSQPQPVSVSSGDSIEEIAQKALRAAQRLSELSKDAGTHAVPAAQYSEGREIAAPF